MLYGDWISVRHICNLRFQWYSIYVVKKFLITTNDRKYWSGPKCFMHCSKKKFYFIAEFISTSFISKNSKIEMTKKLNMFFNLYTTLELGWFLKRLPIPFSLRVKRILSYPVFFCTLEFCPREETLLQSKRLLVSFLSLQWLRCSSVYLWQDICSIEKCCSAWSEEAVSR